MTRWTQMILVRKTHCTSRDGGICPTLTTLVLISIYRKTHRISWIYLYINSISPFLGFFFWGGGCDCKCVVIWHHFSFGSCPILFNVWTFRQKCTPLEVGWRTQEQCSTSSSNILPRTNCHHMPLEYTNHSRYVQLVIAEKCSIDVSLQTCYQLGYGCRIAVWIFWLTMI